MNGSTSVLILALAGVETRALRGGDHDVVSTHFTEMLLNFICHGLFAMVSFSGVLLNRLAEHYSLGCAGMCLRAPATLSVAFRRVQTGWHIDRYTNQRRGFQRYTFFCKYTSQHFNGF